MPDDPITMALLSEYEQTADNLLHSVNVSTETMNKYHGMTGKLLCKAVSSLWTQTELEAQIDTRVKVRCATCDKAVGGWFGVMKVNAKAIIICLTVILVAAIAFNQLRELTGFWRGVRDTVSVQYQSE